MTAGPEKDHFQDQAEAMRRAFDSRFSEARPLPLRAVPSRYLHVRVLGEPFLIPATAVSRVAFDLPLVPLPTSHHALLGVTAIEGRVAVVHGLADYLLGRPSEAGPRVFLRCREAPRLVFATDGFEGQVEPEYGDDDVQILWVGGLPVPVADLGELVRQIITTSDTATKRPPP